MQVSENRTYRALKRKGRMGGSTKLSETGRTCPSHSPANGGTRLLNKGKWVRLRATSVDRITEKVRQTEG